MASSVAAPVATVSTASAECFGRVTASAVFRVSLTSDACKRQVSSELKASRDTFSQGTGRSLRSPQVVVSRESTAAILHVLDRGSLQQQQDDPSFSSKGVGTGLGWMSSSSKDSFLTGLKNELSDLPGSQAATPKTHRTPSTSEIPLPLPRPPPPRPHASAESGSAKQADVADSHPASVKHEVDSMWLEIRADARKAAEEEPALASYIYSTILAHRSLDSALASHLANKLASSTLLSSHILSLFRDVLYHNPHIGLASRRDMEATRTRDPACFSYLQCLLNFKGFLALQVHRVAHQLWKGGRMGLARALQSRMSEVFHVDIHPGARFGSGILLDHATGLVVGETAEVGDDVTMLHNVTLGGTGIVGCTRHPKLESGVVIGAGARLLGPIHVGKGAKIGAGSVVLQDVREGATVVGSPAKEVKKKDRAEDPALLVLDYMI